MGGDEIFIIPTLVSQKNTNMEKTHFSVTLAHATWREFHAICSDLMRSVYSAKKHPLLF